MFHFSGKPQIFQKKDFNGIFVISFTSIRKIDQWLEGKNHHDLPKSNNKVLFVNFLLGVAAICGGTQFYLEWSQTNCLLPVTSNWFGVLWFFRGNRADVKVVSFWKCDSHGLPLPVPQFSIDHILLASIFFLLQKTEFVRYTWVAPKQIFQPLFRTLDNF